VSFLLGSFFQFYKKWCPTFLLLRRSLLKISIFRKPKIYAWSGKTAFRQLQNLESQEIFFQKHKKPCQQNKKGKFEKQDFVAPTKKELENRLFFLSKQQSKNPEFYAKKTSFFWATGLFYPKQRSKEIMPKRKLSWSDYGTIFILFLL
jgi:hypothetical protein